jgi:hypothetical protein
LNNLRLLNFLFFSRYFILFSHWLRNLWSWFLYFLFLLRRLFNLNRRLHARPSKLRNIRSRSGLDISNRRSKLRSTPPSSHPSGHRCWRSIHRRSEWHLLNRCLCHWLSRFLIFLFLPSFEVKFMRRALTSAAISTLFNNNSCLHRDFIFNLLHRGSNHSILFWDDFFAYQVSLLFLGLLRFGFLF